MYTYTRTLPTVTLTRSESRSLSRHVPSTLGDPRCVPRGLNDGRDGETERRKDRVDFCPISMHRVAESFADVISTRRGSTSRDITINAI